MKFYLCLLFFTFAINASDHNNIHNFVTKQEMSNSLQLFNFSKCLWSANLIYIQISSKDAERFHSIGIEELKANLSFFKTRLGIKLSNIFKENILKGFNENVSIKNSIISIYPILDIASFLIHRQTYKVNNFNEKILGPKFYYLAYVSTIPMWIKNLTKTQEDCLTLLNKQIEDDNKISNLEPETMFSVLRNHFSEENFKKINLAYGLNYQYSWKDSCVIS